MPSYKITIFVFVALSSVIFEEVNPVSFLALTPGNAIGGMVTGIIGLALGSVSLAIVLGKIELVDEPEEPRYGSYRKRRNANNATQRIFMEKIYIEEFMDNVYASDSSHCIEKLVCDITTRAKQRQPISKDEEDIISVIKRNSNHGFTFKKMVLAQKVAIGGGDCEFLFDSCHLAIDDMVNFIGESARKVSKNDS